LRTALKVPAVLCAVISTEPPEPTVIGTWTQAPLLKDEADGSRAGPVVDGDRLVAVAAVCVPVDGIEMERAAVWVGEVEADTHLTRVVPGRRPTLGLVRALEGAPVGRRRRRRPAVARPRLEAVRHTGRQA
jgi:hypothetical protein